MFDIFLAKSWNVEYTQSSYRHHFLEDTEMNSKLELFATVDKVDSFKSTYKAFFALRALE